MPQPLYFILAPDHPDADDANDGLSMYAPWKNWNAVFDTTRNSGAGDAPCQAAVEAIGNGYDVRVIVVGKVTPANQTKGYPIFKTGGAALAPPANQPLQIIGTNDPWGEPPSPHDWGLSSATRAIIDAYDASSPWDYCLYDSGLMIPNVVIRNFEFRNASGTNGHGLRFSNTAGCGVLVDNCVARGCQRWGFYDAGIGGVAFQRCWAISNNAGDTGTSPFGGGFHIINGRDLRAVGNVGRGICLYAQQIDCHAARCIAYGTTGGSTSGGAGFYVRCSNSNAYGALLTDCVSDSNVRGVIVGVEGNTNSIMRSAGVSLDNCIFSRNTSRGIRSPYTLCKIGSLSNCFFGANGTSDLLQVEFLVEAGNSWDAGDPLFVDPENYDFRLQAKSPAIRSDGSYPGAMTALTKKNGGGYIIGA